MKSNIDKLIIISLILLFGVLSFDIYQLILNRKEINNNNNVSENIINDYKDEINKENNESYANKNTQTLNTSIEMNNLNIISCSSQYLQPQVVNKEIFCSLDVTYFNQVLNSQGIEQKNTETKGDVSFMCTAASSVMIMGYFNELSYSSTDELREHMYKSLSSSNLRTGNYVKIGNYNIKLCTDGAFGLTSVDPTTGISLCNWNNNVDLYFKYFNYSIKPISTDFNTIKEKIDKGYPILLNVNPYDQRANGIYESHFVVAKGYSIAEGKQRLLLNDPYRDMSVLVDNGICGGLSVPPSLDGNNSIYDYSNHPCMLIVGAYLIYK